MNLICSIFIFSSIVACYAKTDSVKDSLNNKTNTRIIDTTRIINKVLDSIKKQSYEWLGAQLEVKPDKSEVEE